MKISYIMKAYMKVLIITLVASVCIGCKSKIDVAVDEQQVDEQQNPIVERQERIISLREQMEKELGFTIELVRDNEGLESIVAHPSNLPAGEGMYRIYFCWPDKSDVPGALPGEGKMVALGSTRGTGRLKTASGSWSIADYTITTSYPLRDLKRGGGQGLRRESGRVFAVAVSTQGIYVSNIITVPEKQQDTAEPQEASEAE